MGIAILSALPFENIRAHYYAGARGPLQEFTPFVTSQEKLNRVLLYGTFFLNGDESFIIGTVHFTWTPNGEADDLQRRDVRALRKVLDAIPEIVFAGDMNAPRGKEIFSAIAEKYKDNIPARYTTSIDGKLHRSGGLDLMVDGLFSTAQYEIKNARLKCGVSDHCAIVAEVHHAR